MNIPKVYQATLIVTLIAVLYLAYSSQGNLDGKRAFREGRFEQAKRLFSPLAEHGDAEAQNYLGIINQLGLIESKDYSKAVKWYERAARSGNIHAQRNLGAMFQYGWGVKQDYMYAYAWYHKAWGNGNKRAWSNLVLMTNKILPNQIVRAKRLLRQELQHNQDRSHNLKDTDEN